MSKHISEGWLVGSSESLADWAIWPFVRQYRLIDPKSFDEDLAITHLKIWLNRYLNDPLFEVLMARTKTWNPSDEPITFPISKYGI